MFSPFYINLKENIVISLTNEGRMWYNDFIKVAKLAKILNGIKKCVVILENYGKIKFMAQKVL